MGNLRDANFIMVINPRSDISPLDLLSKSGDDGIEPLNSAAYELFLTQSQAPPAIRERAMSDKTDTEEVLDLNIESHVKLLDKLSSLLHSNISADFSFQKQKRLIIKLNKPINSYVSEIALDSFLQGTQLNTAAAGTIEKMKEGELYIITETIKSKSFSIEEERDEQVGMNTNVGVHDIADVSANVSSNKGRKELVKHNSDTQLTFAIKAKQIFFDKPGLFSNKKGIFKLREVENILLVKGADESFPSKPLITTDGVITL